MEKKNFVLVFVVILLVGGVFGFILGKNNKVDNIPEDKIVIIDGENTPKEEEKKDDVVIKKPAPQFPKEEPVACTMDAMMCPDGSYVGRVAPDCNFAMCPVPAGVVEKTLSVGESLEVGGTKMRFDGVKEDSRCMVYAMCLLAGNFVVYVSFDGVSSIVPVEIDWTKPYVFRNKKISIGTIKPEKTITGMFNQNQYKVTFRVE